MEKSELQKQLDKFRDAVIKQSRKNLSQSRKNYSRKLYNSIDGTVKAYENSFHMSFDMEQYGLYVDKGVKGKNPAKVSKNARIKGQQAPNSPYRFGSGTHAGTWPMFTASISQWAQRKNIRLRDEKGKFKKGNYATIGQIIAKNIYNRGLRPTMFFTKAFEAAYRNLPEDLIEKFGLDAEQLFNEQIDLIANKDG